MAAAIEAALGTGADATRLEGPLVTRGSIEQSARDHDLVLYAGHGEWGQLYCTEQTPESLLDAQNVWCLRGRTVVAFACRSGRDLGPQAVDHGADGYLGFTDDLVWPMNARALPAFSLAMSKGVSVLVNGGSLGQMRDVLTDEHLAIYEHYWRGPGRSAQDSHVYAMFAEHFAFRLVVHGDAGARPLGGRQPLAAARTLYLRLSAYARHRREALRVG